jgi:Sec-independent protein translocase protein TatA
MLVVGVVALLLYGGNLPQVARSWGKSFAELRRGLSGFQKEWDDVVYRDPPSDPQRLEYQDESDLQDELLLEDALPEPFDSEDDPAGKSTD